VSDEEGLLGGRYRLFEVLGSGGMATVWRAEDTVLGRPVAVKVLRPDLAAEAGFVDRFRREARHAASLVHPTLVTVFDSGVDGGAVFIVMELVAGRTLRTVLDESGPIDPDEAVRIAAAICEGLEVAHSAGIVHRDIKPANVLLTPGGGVKVFDFGIARADGSESLTLTGKVLGTVAYLAPEQARGEQVGPAADVYALGCVLFEMLTGEPPFRADTPVALVMRQVNDPPPPPSSVRPGLPEDLDRVVLAMLSKDPGQRPAPAGAVRASLLETVAGGVARPVRPDPSAPTVAAATVPTDRGTTMRLPGATADAGWRRHLPAGIAAGTGWRRHVPLGITVGAVVLVLIGLGIELAGSGGPPSAASTHRSTTTTTTTSTTTTAPPTAQAALASLRSTIESGASSGAIDSRAESQLLQKVDAAQTALDNGSPQAARSPMTDLEQQLADLQSQGDVNSSAASSIDQLLQAVLAALPAQTAGGDKPGKGGHGGPGG
jgi:eukaryotic-like serine/threonine-protein kinase